MVQNVSTQAITLPVCQTAIMTLQGLWSEIQFLQAIGDSQIVCGLCEALRYNPRILLTLCDSFSNWDRWLSLCTPYVPF